MLRAWTTNARDSRVGPSLPSTTIARTPSFTSQFASISPVGPAPTTRTSQLSSAVMSLAQGGHVAQEQRLGEADPGELAEVQALVGAVRGRMRILDAGHQDRRIGEELLEGGDERDR